MDVCRVEQQCPVGERWDMFGPDVHTGCECTTPIDSQAAMISIHPDKSGSSAKVLN